ncbi:MAG: SRPBCC family protein [Actinomycetota bacterium]|nr:SRPBCC family protein [Actinomycetota bacterium]
MGVHILQREQRLPGAPAEVFAFFADARNLEAITPPWLGFRVLTPEPIAMRAGTRIRYELRVRRVPISWLTEIRLWEPPHRFLDAQLRGPYALWEHTHSFSPAGDGATIMRDVVRYALALGPLGALAHRLVVRRDLEAIFDFRAQTVSALLAERGGRAGR